MSSAYPLKETGSGLNTFLAAAFGPITQEWAAPLAKRGHDYL
jgi:hypothetical protein